MKDTKATKKLMKQRKRPQALRPDSKDTAQKFELGVRLIAPIKLQIRREAGRKWDTKWKKEVKGKALRRVAPTVSKRVMALHKGKHPGGELGANLEPDGKDKLQSLSSWPPRARDRRSPCEGHRGPRQTARHILEGSELFQKMRERYWISELVDKKVVILTAVKMITQYPCKAVSFIWKTVDTAQASGGEA